jgi:hypothetical protein
MMPKQKFDVTGLDALLVGPMLGPPEHEKICFGVSHNERTKTCYMTSILYVMQKHNFSVTCHGVLLVGPAT